MHAHTACMCVIHSCVHLYWEIQRALVHVNVYWTYTQTLIRAFPCERFLAEVHAWQTLCCSAGLFIAFSVSICFSLLPPSLSVCLSVYLLVSQQTNTAVILQTIFIRSSHSLCRTSLSSHNPRRHHQNPFWYCEEGMNTMTVCVYVCPSPLSLPLFFPLSACQLSMFPGWQDRRRDDCSAPTQRPFLAKPGMKSFL